MNIDTSQTPEKFQDHAKGILDFLLNALRELNLLEQEICKRNEALKNPSAPNQVQTGQMELWEEYRLRYRELTSIFCLNPPKDVGSFGEPASYDYLEYPDTKISFTMKSANRAVIETQYEYGIEKKEQFVLKKQGDQWKIDTKKYGFPDENSWWQDDL